MIRWKYLKYLFIGIVLLLSMLLYSPCQAILGVGDIVFDPSVYVQAIQSYLKQLETASNTATQIENQMRALENQARNLQHMSPSAASLSLSRIQANMSALATVRDSMRGISMDYARLQNAYDSVYKNFASYNNNTPAKEYANQAQKLLDQSSNSAYDAMRAQGLTAQIGDDEANLRSLIQASQSASGAVSAAQVGNQLSGMTVQQLMRLQEIVAASNRAQTSYFAAEAQKQAMSETNLKRQLDFGPPRKSPLAGPGKGPGIQQY
ncbi:MAG: P-type conjugative transfer protein TrbJ [Syntrophobacterales bacterium]|jgi:P-type conjugative transfer protein TrbJ|nr:P-type conjugative transfer protein TrbJ [Syntrophobacterales bacterium]